MIAMQPRELFGVGVRILGVWFWTQAVYIGFWALLKGLGYSGGNPNVSSREDVGFLILYVLLGLFLMAGARALIWVAYGDAPKAAADSAGDVQG